MVRSRLIGPPSQHSLELQAALYDSKNPTRRWLHRTRRDWIIDAIDRYGRPDHRALEIGPGSGIYLPILADRCKLVDAADVAPEFLGRARELAEIHKNLSVLEDDITDSKISAATYDLVLCTEVIEHIENSTEALENIHRILNPGGIIILSTPQRYSIIELASKIAFLPGVIDIVRAIYGEAIGETGHINLLTAKKARSQIKDAGFAIIETFFSGLYLPIIAEFLGNKGLFIAQSFENVLIKNRMTAPLWTQYYVAYRI